MAKKQETNTASKASLIISRDEFKSRLDDCISNGSSVANINVPRQQDFWGNTQYVAAGQEYENFMQVYSNWVDYCLEVLKQAFDKPNNEYYQRFENEGVCIVYTSTTNIIQVTRSELTQKISYLTNLRDNLLPLLPISSNIKKDIVTSSTMVQPTKNVFIVHGHDVSKRNEVELLIKKLDHNPIILCKEPNKGQTIIEKIESNADGACYAIVIYSACDMGRDKNAKEDHPRARQNVVFEHGYLNGKLGRDKVAALMEDGVEQPGDLSGIVYIPFDTAGMWKFQIIKEMKAIGLDVDANKIC